MTYPWSRIDNGLPRNDKIMRLKTLTKGKEYAFDYIACILYSNEQGTDGLIEVHVLKAIDTTKRVMGILVENGLMLPVPNGWMIKNFDERQQTSEARSLAKQLQVTGASRGGCAKNHGPDCWTNGRCSRS